MKKLRFPALLLALVLLAGCTPKTPVSDATSTPESGNNQNTAETDLAYVCAGVKRDFPLLTVDGQAVEAEEYLFWLANSILTWNAYGMLSTEEAWDSLGENLKADALDVAILYQVVENKAHGMGITFADVEALLDADLNAVVEENGGREVYQAFLDSMCISWDGFRRVNGVYYLNQAMLEKLAETGEIDGRTVDEFLEENDIYGAKHILIQTRRQLEDGSYEGFSDEEKAEAYQKILSIREQIRAENDSEEAFDRLMNEFSEDGRYPTGELAAPDGYTYVYPGYMVPEFEAGALALRVGQVGDVVTTDFGYHIILRIPADREQATGEMLAALIEEWIDEAEVVTDPAYDTIDPKAFYEKLTEENAQLHPETES